MNSTEIVKRKTVGIGSVCVETGSAELVAYALGSCIALCLYDSMAQIGAMAHILLPSRSYKTSDESTRYADMALKKALRIMRDLGADKSRITAAIVGGAQMFPHGDLKTLNIGQMNVESIVSELEKSRIPLVYSVTGGNRSRTVTMSIPGSSFEDRIKIKYPSL